MLVQHDWNVMAHVLKSDFVFRRNGPVHLNRAWWGCQLSGLLAAEVCASAVVMLDTACSEVVWRVLATYCIRQFSLQFPYRASPCAITFQLESKVISPVNCIKIPFKQCKTLWNQIVCDVTVYRLTCDHFRNYALGRNVSNRLLVDGTWM